MGRLDGQVAVVTGGGSGLGRATVERFVAEGATVFLADIEAGRGERAAAELGAYFVQTDVTDEAQVERLVRTAVEREGRLDCMVNNAGALGAVGSILDLNLADWNRTIAILLTSVMFGIKHAGRVMRDQQSGCILSTSSTAGLAPIGPPAYTVAKHGVIGLTRTAASELAVYGVRVNAVAPGTVPSGMTSNVFGGDGDVRAAAIGKNPLPRTVEPEEIAAGFAYLASADAINVTGHVLSIDAGLIALPKGTNYRDQPSRFVDARVDAPLSL